MDQRRPAEHRSILVVDVEGFSGDDRTEDHRKVVRAQLRGILSDSLGEIGVELDTCFLNDTGDGTLVLLRPEVPEQSLVHPLPKALEARLRQHNSRFADGARIRLRVALHHGQVNFDESGATSAAVIHAFRLLDSAALKQGLRHTDGPLALVTSEHFYQEVVRNEPAAAPESYRRIEVAEKETVGIAWMYLPGGAAVGDLATMAAQAPALPTWLDDKAPKVLVVPGGERLADQLVLAVRKSPPLVEALRANLPFHYLPGTPADALHALADALLLVPSMAEEATRKAVLSELPIEIRTSVPRSSVARQDVLAIVRTCASRNDGLGSLFSAVARTEGQTLDLDDLHTAVVRVLASLIREG